MARTKWFIDPTHSTLGFKIKHLMITNVSGSFKNFNAEVETNGTDFSTAAIQLKAEISSIDTNNAQRDGHLRTSDFFEAETYPEMIFESTKVEKVDEENYHVFGNLTMKGVTKPVKLNVEFGGVTKIPFLNVCCKIIPFCPLQKNQSCGDARRVVHYLYRLN